MLYLDQVLAWVKGKVAFIRKVPTDAVCDDEIITNRGFVVSLLRLSVPMFRTPGSLSVSAPTTVRALAEAIHAAAREQ